MRKLTRRGEDRDEGVPNCLAEGTEELALVGTDVEAVLLLHLSIRFHLVQAFVVKVVPTALSIETSHDELLRQREQFIRVLHLFRETLHLFQGGTHILQRSLESVIEQSMPSDIAGPPPWVSFILLNEWLMAETAALVQGLFLFLLLDFLHVLLGEFLLFLLETLECFLLGLLLLQALLFLLVV